jgi:hypothetical protein
VLSAHFYYTYACDIAQVISCVSQIIFFGATPRARSPTPPTSERRTMTRAQRSHDDALGKTTTPFSDSPARRSAAQLSFVFILICDLRYKKETPHHF